MKRGKTILNYKLEKLRMHFRCSLLNFDICLPSCNAFVSNQVILRNFWWISSFLYFDIWIHAKQPLKLANPGFSGLMTNPNGLSTMINKQFISRGKRSIFKRKENLIQFSNTYIIMHGITLQICERRTLK